MGPTVEIEAKASVVVLATVAGVCATLAGADTAGAAAVGPTVHVVNTMICTHSTRIRRNRAAVES